jgi:hypothetical protein
MAIVVDVFFLQPITAENIGMLSLEGVTSKML